MNKTIIIGLIAIMMLSLSATAMLYYYSPEEPYQDGGYKGMIFTCSDGFTNMIWASQCVYFKELYYSAKDYCNQRENIGYSNTYFQCYDGYTWQSDMCLKQESINIIRDKVCEDNCANGKCGINTYRLGNKCQIRNSVKSYSFLYQC